MRTVRIPYRPPYDWGAMLAFFAARAIEGIERVDGDAYERTVRVGGAVGSIRVTHRPEHQGLVAEIDFPEPRVIVARLRRLFDVDADVTAIGAWLARDPLLAPLVRARPGLRPPGAFDDFELAVRAVLGQQITVVAARKLGGQLVRIAGRPAGDGRFVFPTPEEVRRGELDALGMPKARRETLRALAELDDVARIRTVKGVGEWTAQYVALRAGRDPDAFPATDVALLRAAALCIDALDGAALDAAALLARAERWRPYRAYAAQHLWTSLTGSPA